MTPCKKDYKYPIDIGPGGIHCQCCAPAETVKKSRIVINRAHRRKSKLKLKKDEDYV